MQGCSSSHSAKQKQIAHFIYKTEEDHLEAQTPIREWTGKIRIEKNYDLITKSKYLTVVLEAPLFVFLTAFVLVL